MVTLGNKHSIFWHCNVIRSCCCRISNCANAKYHFGNFWLAIKSIETRFQATKSMGIILWQDGTTNEFDTVIAGRDNN